MKTRTQKILDQFYIDNPSLISMKDSLEYFCETLVNVFQNGGKVLICGNGGSCSDAEHIVGELMKGFMLKRPLKKELQDSLTTLFGQDDGGFLAKNLQRSLRAIALSNHSSLNSAFANDVDPTLVYAQQVQGYCDAKDLLIGISTSGNAKNVYYALLSAKAIGAKTLALTGNTGGMLAKIADSALVAPSEKTYRIQEHHVAIYHCFCAYVESELFES